MTVHESRAGLLAPALTQIKTFDLTSKLLDNKIMQFRSGFSSGRAQLEQVGDPGPISPCPRLQTTHGVHPSTKWKEIGLE